mmetsp:Transcript_8282/g.24574  ORF Transcript_8282/g.24574 Transcript_8282/m.24574 type:complete len:235 (+) Transcript_8282:1158-1862(+)
MRCGKTALRRRAPLRDRRADPASRVDRAPRLRARKERGSRPPGFPPRLRGAEAVREGGKARPAHRASGADAPDGPARVSCEEALRRGEARDRALAGRLARPHAKAPCEGDRAPKLDAHASKAARAARCHRGGDRRADGRSPVGGTEPLPGHQRGDRLAGDGPPLYGEEALRRPEGGAKTASGGPAYHRDASPGRAQGRGRTANLHASLRCSDALSKNRPRRHRAPGPLALSTAT